LLGTTIYSRPKGQKGVTLFSSEAKYVAMSEVVKVIMLVYYLLLSLEISAKLPIIMRTNNIGAIFMAEILPQKFVPDVLIPDSISFVSMWRMFLFKLFLSRKTKMMLIFLLRM
jgi:hypothetical protein